MNGLQQATIDRLCRENGGRVAVREGWVDGSVEVTLLNLANFRVSLDGVPHLQRGLDTSGIWHRSYDA